MKWNIKAVLLLSLAAPLLAACATEPSAPTVFGARILPVSPIAKPGASLADSR